MVQYLWECPNCYGHRYQKDSKDNKTCSKCFKKDVEELNNLISGACLHLKHSDSLSKITSLILKYERLCGSIGKMNCADSSFKDELVLILENMEAKE